MQYMYIIHTYIQSDDVKQLVLGLLSVWLLSLLEQDLADHTFVYLGKTKMQSFFSGRTTKGPRPRVKWHN